MTELTQLLHKVREGDDSARDALFAAAYTGLEKLARARELQRGETHVAEVAERDPAQAHAGGESRGGRVARGESTRGVDRGGRSGY